MGNSTSEINSGQNVFMYFTKDKINLYLFTLDYKMVGSHHRHNTSIFAPMINYEPSTVTLTLTDSNMCMLTNDDNNIVSCYYGNGNISMQNVYLGDINQAIYNLNTFYEFITTDGRYIYPMLVDNNFITQDEMNNNTPMYVSFGRDNRALINWSIVIFVIIVIIFLFLFFISVIYVTYKGLQYNELRKQKRKQKRKVTEIEMEVITNKEEE